MRCFGHSSSLLRTAAFTRSFDSCKDASGSPSRWVRGWPTPTSASISTAMPSTP
ncbi:hypothetical protein DFR72_10230 [Lentzea flaviverrucosa]|uniref:Uncharacterized protein n=1 Tax=Lentzea flaviverrucosa TaxID=200379 RepID=A0A1H9QX76_9PSEU|nr:hypothetical protein DFR72_10230 [Lentzea flaviverrucosa]SER64313.1 hypothetical protein SAMN05216195_10631 [Lentzea flaviverrucosa]